MATWFAVYQVSDGLLISTGQVVASDSVLSAKGFAKKQFAFDPQIDTKQWNPSTLLFDDIVLPKPFLAIKEFLDRLTDSELTNVLGAREESNLTKTQRKNVIAGTDYIRALEDGISVEDPRIMKLVNFWETIGLIAPGRAAGILA